MNSTKRGRGRPIGTGLNDAPILNEIADMIVASPGLRPTTAIRRCLEKPGPSNIRRLQVKWKAGATEYLAQAQKRLAAGLAPAPARGVSGGYTRHTVRQVMEAPRKMQDGPVMCAINEYMNSPTMRAMRELHDSPIMRAMREMHDSPIMRAMREMHDSPIMRAMREMQDSPIMRAMREMQDSPIMRAMREMHDSPAVRAVRGG